MKLYRTVCNTDWKSRPHHVLTDMGTGTKEELVQRMDQDIREWMAQEVARVQIEEAEDQDADEETLALQLQDDPELAGKWKNEGRFEMKLCDGDGHREFVERMDGDRCTTVYHLAEELAMLHRRKPVTRAIFVRQLRALGDIPIPEGQARRNKGLTSYFFPHNKIEEVARFLRTHLDDDGPRFLGGYVPIALRYVSPDGERRIILYIQNEFVSVVVLRWPA